MMRGLIIGFVFCGVCVGAVVDEVVPFSAEAFALKDVRLLEGPFKHAQDLQSDWLLALEPDLTTIKSVRFFRQTETPGLGGEIVAEWFQTQFEGKSIISSSGKPGFKIGKPGQQTDANSVDGISGATMTSDKVEDILAVLAEIVWKARSENE